MLKNRKKILALILGVSLGLSVPAYAAETEKTEDLVQQIPDAGNETEETEGTQNIKETEVTQPEARPTTEKPEVIMDNEMLQSEIPEINSETVVSPYETILAGSGGTSASYETETKQSSVNIEKLMVEPEIFHGSFRFETIDKKYALAKKNIKIYTEKDKDSAAAGTLKEGGLCYILEKGTGWFYVESGNVRGFVKKKYLITGVKAKETVKKQRLGNMVMAEETLEPSENPAFTYTKTTVRETVAERVYAVAENDELNIREEKTTDARIIGVIPKGGLCYILADQGEEWCYVESGDVRGFVKSELLLTGKRAKKLVKATGRKKMQLAEEKILPEDNKALYYTLTSTEEAYAAKGKYLGKFKLTAYCACSICCGDYADGITASGTVPVQGKTIAMYGVPFGTRLAVGDKVYTVEDRGTPYGHIDIYMVNHEDAAAFGVQEADVYLAK